MFLAVAKLWTCQWVSCETRQARSCVMPFSVVKWTRATECYSIKHTFLLFLYRMTCVECVFEEILL